MIPDNPFVSNADPVDTKHFIGRNAEIQGKIKKAVFAHESLLNLSIIGIPNIGKTSLINNAVLVRKDELKKCGVYPIVLDISILGNPLSFFRLLARKTLTHLEENNLYQDKVQRMKDSVTTEMTEENFVGNITVFFEAVEETVEKTRDFHALFILDRFDHAKSVLDELTYLNLLRNLASKSCLSFLVLSCRSVTDIEKGITGSFSPFGKSFEAPLRLEMFRNDDVDIYFQKYEGIGISISKADKERILSYCGRHPYLLQSLGYKIVDMYSTTKEINVDAAAAAISEEDVFSNYYQRLITFLEDVKRLLPLCQILSGTLTSVDSDAKTELEKYGLISETETGNYVAYSGHFHDYLKLHERETEFADDLHAIWSKTENALREVITTTMSGAYGDDWIKELEKTRPNLKQIFDKCRQAQQKEEKLFPDQASQNLIDFTYPADLFRVILAKGMWEQHFQPIFGEYTNYWDERGKFLAKCRTPLGHNRDNILKSDQRKIFEAYCDEILGVLSPTNSD